MMMLMMISLKKIALFSQAIILLFCALTVKGYGRNNLSPNQSIDPISRSTHHGSRRRPLPNDSSNRSLHPIPPSSRLTPNGSPTSRSINQDSSSTFGRGPMPNTNTRHPHRQNRVLSPLPSSSRSNTLNSNNIGRRAFPTTRPSSFKSNHNNLNYGGATASSSSSVAFMITTKMKRILIEDLQYSRREVTSMSPDEAHQIISNRIFNPIFSQNRIPTDKCLGGGDGTTASEEEEEACPISMTSPPPPSTDIGNNNMLEEMDIQFCEVTERVLKDDNFGGPLFPDQQQQQTNHNHQNHHAASNEPLKRRSNTFPSSTLYRW